MQPVIKIDYPPYQPKIKKENNNELIFDEVRRKWIVLTPEEWVRQNFLQYLIKVQNIPASLIAVEKEIQTGDLKKRFDIVVYKNSLPHILIECKEPEIALSQPVLEQALRYHISLKVPYVLITNGSYTTAFSTTSGKLEQLEEFPQ